MQVWVHIYLGLGGQEKYGMVTRFPGVLPLEASAVMQLSVNNTSRQPVHLHGLEHGKSLSTVN